MSNMRKLFHGKTNKLDNLQQTMIIEVVNDDTLNPHLQYVYHTIHIEQAKLMGFWSGFFFR